MQSKVCVMTHANCRDGFVAFLCAKYHYKDQPEGDKNIVYWTINASYQLEDLNKFLEHCLITYSDIHDFNIRSFDVAFVPDVIKEFTQNCTNKGLNIQFSIYDHHKTAIDAWIATYAANSAGSLSGSFVVQCDNMYFKGDLSECGASLAWKYYFPGKQMPLFIQYVKDRDNWLFDTPEAKTRNSMDVNEYLMATAPESEAIEKWFDYFQIPHEDEVNFYNSAAKMGKIITDMKNKQINALSRSGGIRTICGRRVFVSNCTLMQSDVGNFIVNLVKDKDKIDVYRHPDVPESLTGEYLCDWAILWRWDEEDKVNHVSLRSRKGGVDVSAIAKGFGGGGHAAAAGFKISDINQIFTQLSDPTAIQQ